jgi:hypothetical protein
LLKDALAGSMKNNRLSCKNAWQIARRFNISKLKVCNISQACGIQIGDCQLGDQTAGLQHLEVVLPFALAVACRIAEGEALEPVLGDHPLFHEIIKDLGREPSIQ